MAKRVAKANLSTLANEINAAHAEAFGHAKAAILKAAEVGRLLAEAKAQVEHGGWASWVAENCEFGIRQAQKYARAFENRPAIEAALASNANSASSHLTLNEALALIAEPAREGAEGEANANSASSHLTLNEAPVMEAHEACSMVPDMTPEEFERLCCSIADHGLGDPIATFKGKILDGRQRYRACLEVGVEPRFKEVQKAGKWADRPDDEFIASYIQSIHLGRSGYTAEQLAEIDRKMGDYMAGKAEKRPMTKARADAIADEVRARSSDAVRDWEGLVRETLRRKKTGELDSWLDGFDGPMREALAWAVDHPIDGMSLSYAMCRHPAAFGEDPVKTEFVASCLA